MPFLANEKLKANRLYPKTVKDWVLWVFFSFSFERANPRHWWWCPSARLCKVRALQAAFSLRGPVCTRKPHWNIVRWSASVCVACECCEQLNSIAKCLTEMCFPYESYKLHLTQFLCFCSDCISAWIWSRFNKYRALIISWTRTRAGWAERRGEHGNHVQSRVERVATLPPAGSKNSPSSVTDSKFSAFTPSIFPLAAIFFRQMTECIRVADWQSPSAARMHYDSILNGDLAMPSISLFLSQCSVLQRCNRQNSESGCSRRRSAVLSLNGCGKFAGKTEALMTFS